MIELRRRIMVSAGGSPFPQGFVDLGLPSGLLWAKGNLCKDSQGNYSIGEETDYGTYVSWGNTDGHNNGDGYSFGSTNYNKTPGKSVSGDIPSNDATHDIAFARLGTPWHLPTKENFQEIYDNTDSERTTINGITGHKFMKKSDHSVYIFLPASGRYYGTNLQNSSNGYYWSSSYDPSGTAYLLLFSSSAFNPQYHNVGREYGLTVRPVCNL